MLPRSEHPVYLESDVDSMIDNVSNPKGELDRGEVKAMLYYLKGLSTGNKALKKLVVIMSLCFVTGLAAIFGVAYMANEYAKDYRVTDSKLTGLDGNVIAVANAEKYGDLYSLPTQSVETLSNLKEISCFVDMTAIPEVNGWTQGTFKVTSAYKKLGTQEAFFTTADAHTIKIDASTKVASLTMNGKTLAVTDEPPATVARALAEAPVLPAPTLKARRKLNGRRGGASNRGASSFTMAGGSNRAGND